MAFAIWIIACFIFGVCLPPVTSFISRQVFHTDAGSVQWSLIVLGALIPALIYLYILHPLGII